MNQPYIELPFSTHTLLPAGYERLDTSSPYYLIVRHDGEAILVKMTLHTINAEECARRVADAFQDERFALVAAV